MPVQIEKLPEELEQLQKEIRKHPPLWEKLKNSTDIAEYIAECCTYVDILIDGYYTAEDIRKLCIKLTDKLYVKRTGLVILQ